MRLSRLACLVLACLWGLWASGADARPKTPEGPTAHATCTDLVDNDQTNLRDAADTAACSAAATFSDVGDGYAAQGEDFRLAGGWASVVDTTADGGDYITLASGNHPFNGQAAGSGIAAGTYHVFLRAQVTSAAAAEVFLKAGTTPFGQAPNIEDGAVLHNGMVTNGWTWLGPLGRYDTTSAAKTRTNTTAQRELVVTTGDLLYLMAPPGLWIDCVYVRPTTSVEAPQCPAGGSGGGSTADFLVKEMGANAEQVDGVENSYWTQANVIPFLGTDTGVTGINASVRFVWKTGTPDRLGVIAKLTKAGLTSLGNAEDDVRILSDSHVEVGYKLGNMDRVRDANTYKIACNSAGFIYDRNDAGGVSNPAFDHTNRSCGVTYTSNNLVIELFWDAPADISAGTQFLFDGALSELVSGSSVKHKIFFSSNGSNLTPVLWGIGEIDDAIMEVPADTTAPTVNNLVFSNETASGFSMTADTNEAGLCYAGTDTVNDNTVDDSLLVLCGQSSGGKCHCTKTDGVANTAYEAKVCVTDPAGLRGCTAVGDRTTSATGAVRYISPTGNDSNNGQTTGTPWKTFAHAFSQLTAGMTLVLRDGTYSDGTTGLIVANCASGGNAVNGTVGQPITIKAENARLAYVLHSGGSSTALPVQINNCAYWVIENLRIKHTDTTANTTSGGTVQIRDSNNITFKGNFVAHPNSCKNASLMELRMTDSLVEENEFVDFYRNGVGSGQRVRYNKNYMNSKGATNPACSTYSGSQPTTRGDGGYTWYADMNPALDLTLENSVSEGNEFGVDISCIHPHQRLRVFSTLAYNNFYGFKEGARGNNSSKVCIDTLFQNNVSIGHKFWGFASRSSPSIRMVNNTAIARETGSGVGEYGMLMDMPSDWYGTKSYNGTFLNNLLINHTKRGLLVEDPVSNGQTGNTLVWVADKNNAYNNIVGNFSPSASTSNGTITGSTTNNPSLGSSGVCIPRTSPVAGAGQGGADQGANLLKVSVNGVPTSENLWTTSNPGNCPVPTSGLYHISCGPCISGMNTAAGHCWDLADRIGLTLAELNSCTVGGTY